jgi:uncharacterized protein (TIGR00369 family)
MEEPMRSLPRYPECFICGRKNFAGTDVTFFLNGEGVECFYTARDKHQSYKGILHGGIISALLDECMGWAVGVHEKRMCVTGELNVKFIRSVPIDTEIKVKGFFSDLQDNDKYRSATGTIEDMEGNVYATGEGKFHPVPVEFEEPVFSLLEIENDPTYKVTREDVWGGHTT